jgi:hypothetical protein
MIGVVLTLGPYPGPLRQVHSSISFRLRSVLADAPVPT